MKNIFLGLLFIGFIQVTFSQHVPIPLSRIELYFEQIHTQNDSLALSAYMKLLDEDYRQVISVMKDFDMKSKTVKLNSKLRTLTQTFLTQQCYLSEYCKVNKIQYKPTGDLLELLDKVRNGTGIFAEEIKHKEALLSNITLKNIIAVENYTLIHGHYWNNDQLSFLVGHVLDIWYSQNIDAIVSNKQALRTYLYKMDLYAHLGVTGEMNNYEQKLKHLSPNQLIHFYDLAKNDTLNIIKKNAASVIRSLTSQEEKTVPYSNQDEKSFIQDLKKLSESSEISSDELYDIAESKFWNPKKHGKYLNDILDKMTDEDIFQIKSTWGIPEYTFERVIECEESIYYLKKIANDFHKERPIQVIQWLQKQEDLDDVSNAINHLCWNLNFLNVLKEDSNTVYKKWVIDILKYLIDEDVLVSSERNHTKSIIIELELSSLSLENSLKKITTMQGEEGVEEVLSFFLEDVTYKELQQYWKLIKPLCIQNPSMIACLQHNIQNKLFLLIFNEDLEEKNIDDIIINNPHHRASLLLINEYLPIHKQQKKLDYQFIFETLKYGNTQCFMGRKNMSSWTRYYMAVKGYVAVLWKNELEKFIQEFYPSQTIYDQEVILNYMVYKKWIPSQKHVPISFAHNKEVFIR